MIFIVDSRANLETVCFFFSKKGPPTGLSTEICIDSCTDERINRVTAT